MIKELLEVKPTDSFPEMCARMGAFLGLDGQLPENAMRRAIEDEGFANDLIACRNAPGFLKALLDDPKNGQYAEAAEKKIGHTDLIRNAANAFVRWGKAGFSIVSDDVLETRENACIPCEHLVKPEKMLQKLMTSDPTEQVGRRTADCVCRLCGCSVSKKIRLPTESCPANHPEKPGMTRWGEPR